MTPSAPWRFELAIDRAARGWLEEHPDALRLFIAFESTRVRRFGVRLRDTRIRCDSESSRRRVQERTWLPLGNIHGRAVSLDARLRDPCQGSFRSPRVVWVRYVISSSISVAINGASFSTPRPAKRRLVLGDRLTSPVLSTKRVGNWVRLDKPL